MSYDLFLKPENNKFSKGDFDRYFSGRKNYNVEGCQAWYQNEDTGVNFLFELQDESDRDENEEFYPVAFNMNYFRPSYFAYEAEPEVRSFINEFSMIVDDPQAHGMGIGEYSTEKFLKGWAYGNEFGYQSILRDHPDVATLPETVLKSVWEWNHNKEKLQNSVTDDVFVPRIMLLSYRGNVVTAVVWPDAIPSVIPEVDILLIGRKELAPRKLFKKVEDMAIARWSDFEPLLERHKTKMKNSGYYLYYESVPQEIQEAVKSLSASESELEGLANDQVLDRELVQKYVG